MNSNWNTLGSLEQLDFLLQESSQKAVIIFKHSTRCSVSSMVMNRLDELPNEFYSNADFNYLDLISHRDVSNAIAVKLMVEHESPQVLVIRNGECIFQASHFDIKPSKLLELNL